MDKRETLGNWLANKILLENKKITKVVAIYPGRFQPMGKHHAQTYKWLQSKFSDAYVATSGVVSLPKSPFSFNEKKRIINSHGISKVVKVKNPYKATEILKRYDPETTAAVFMVGSKDASRLGGKFFRPWKGKAEVGYKDGAYTIIAPHTSLSVSGYGEMSGTTIRKALGDKSLDKKEKTKLFKGIFGHTKNYDMIIKKLEKLNELIERFLRKSDLTDIIREISNNKSSAKTDSDKNEIDDGPRYFYGTQKSYRTDTKKMAERLGMDVLNYIVPDNEFFQHGTKFPKGPTGTVSYFPTGIPGEFFGGTRYLRDKIGRDAYDRWSRWSKYLAQASGYKFVEFLNADMSIQQSKKEPQEQDKDILKIQKDLVKQKKTGEELEIDYVDDLDVNKAEVNEGWSKWLVDQVLLTEGGAYGHMSHPFDDRGLTFGDFKRIIDISLQGTLDLEQSATEKTDGQNLFITWNKGLRAARNTGDIKRGGVDSKAIATKFAGRGNIEKAFNYAMRDLTKAIGSINDKQKKKIFDDGNNWVNMEIMYPASSNVINYDAPRLQFHNVLKYKGGSPIGAVSDGARMLAGMIAQVNANVQKSFSVIGPKILKLKKHQDFAAKKPYFIGKLNKLMGKLKMNDGNSFAQYHQAWWEQYVDKNIGKVENRIKMGLVKRWAFSDKSFRLNKKTIDDEKVLAKAIEIDKQKHDAQVKRNMLPFETLFFELGAEVLKNAEGFLAANPDKAIQGIRRQVAKAIGDVRKGGDIKKLNRLSQQLNKIKAIGGFKTIVPSEGLVFIYKGKTYKLTGAFAPINQITGMMTF
jgi:hypothetical protein